MIDRQIIQKGRFIFGVQYYVLCAKCYFVAFFYFYKDKLLSFKISSAMFMIHFEMFTGGRSWHGIIGNHLCSSRRLVHVRADDYDQTVDGQMDHGGVNLLLLFVHCITILSRILHFNPNGHCFGSWRCSHVECQMYIPVASKYEKRSASLLCKFF